MDYDNNAGISMSQYNPAIPESKKNQSVEKKISHKVKKGRKVKLEDWQKLESKHKGLPLY
jgi:hypothetical protein